MSLERFVLKGAIIDGFVWKGESSLHDLETFLDKNLPKTHTVAVEYSAKEWIIRYSGTYTSLKEGTTVFIHRNSVIVIREEQDREKDYIPVNLVPYLLLNERNK